MVSFNPFSNCKVRHGTVVLALVKDGLSVEMDWLRSGAQFEFVFARGRESSNVADCLRDLSECVIAKALFYLGSSGNAVRADSAN